MSAKRKPHQANKPGQNQKRSLKKPPNKKRSESNRDNSPSFELSLSENSDEFLEQENKSCEDTNTISDYEENALKEFKAKKNVVYLTTTLKKKKSLGEIIENGTKIKQRKEPLPMKLRAFPQSFWQQPNKTPSVSPGNVYCVPSPLSKEEDSPETRETLEEVLPPIYRENVSEPNIDLLFSLFRNVEEQQRKALGQERAIIRRGRPKKSKNESKVIRDDDPYLTSSAAESLLPFLPIRNSVETLQSKIAKDEQILAMVSIDGSASNLLTSANSVNQNYSQILSELVVQL